MFFFRIIALFVPMSLFVFPPQILAKMIFPVELLKVNGGELADMSDFSADGTQLPGQYQVDVYLNNTFIQRKAIVFNSTTVNTMSAKEVKDKTGLYPCLTVEDLSLFGVKTEFFYNMNEPAQNNCISFTEHIPGASYVFNFSKMRLDVSIPQLYVRNTSRGYIDPSFWDEGINAALLNYTFSGNSHVAGSDNDKNYFLSLSGGLNVGAWRLRDFRTWNYYASQSERSQQWQRINTYLERPIAPLKSALLIGEGTTSGNIFDALRFRGIQLATDDDMYPDSMRGFAPVVRGSASDNADVTISQNGYIIYKTTVPPGPFAIDDLNPMAASGDLTVTVSEANGKTNVFTVPYTAMPVLLREGRLKYGLTFARFRSTDERYDNPGFMQGTLVWGAPYNTTLYGGTQYSPDYLAVQSGAGINMGRPGAFSVDITHANSTLANGKGYRGQSLRVLHSRTFNDTGTRLRLAGYRYSTKGFHTLTETALRKMSGHLYDPGVPGNSDKPGADTRTEYYDLTNSRRARLEVNISQPVGGYGSVWLSGVKQTYWRNKQSSDSFQAGYSGTAGPVSYTINYGETRQKNAKVHSWTDRTVGLSLSVPLEKLLSRFSEKNYNTYATFYGSRDGQGRTSQMAGLSGSLLEDNNLNWSMSQNVGGSRNDAGNASLAYRGTYGNTSVGYSRGTGYQQVNYSISGGAILHREGLTLGQPSGDTAVLISTGGVSDISIQSEPGVRTDWRGFAIKPYSSSYRENRVAIDSKALDDHTDVVDTGAIRVVPTKGAIVRADFNVRRGYRVLFTLTRSAKPLPFGTVVTGDGASGLVGDDGQVYLSGMPEKGEIEARWGKSADQSCVINYSLTKNALAASVARIDGSCR
ncbi:fimbria/pilus outer membrane usher protein [Citrobacter koseri]|uniref:fimbria/pilus outer membrane usher protein n=1 Tax=Citrobacter koseri TaxID=545 RepID=UPI0019069BBD|nr:fimbria/pilus outer membrane usher protein [Citrobacter koseri]MBJ9122321.1 fimbria/pilus outer membrane usher protein [Citrobacter koseri]MBJ9245691.1 fimbria/pilus outer membrane usher protein [Citrobacter koseri]